VKRRLTLSILGIVAATLVLAGVGTLVFARVGARNAAEADLRGQADSTAELVGLGQNRLTQVTADLQNLFCNRGDASGLTADQRAMSARVKTALCTAPDQAAVSDATTRSCTDNASRLSTTISADVEAKRKAFCDNPSTATLQTYREAFCSGTPTSNDAAIKRRINQARNNLCLARPGQAAAGTNIASTLQKESIQLVAIGADNQVAADSLPEDLTVDQLEPDRLRNDETVSGSVGSNVFAAAPIAGPVGPNDPIRAIVIERAASPINDSVQWFLLAAGITLALGAVVAAWLSRRLTQPLRLATDVTKQIAEGDLSSRLPEHEIPPRGKPDELDELAHSINAMADRLERSRGLERQFLLSVSHDLRTPLTSIRGYAEAIADGAAPDSQQAATVILGESRRLERLVKDLLDLAKLESQSFDFHPIDVDVSEIADESVDGFRREVEAEGLHIVLYGGTTPAVAHVDPDRLQQVIANLVENAVKFASSTIAVTVATVPGSTRIEVADDGPGIAVEDLPHVFERLYVASHTPKRRETGSGLGLAIVRELVDAMGARVAAEVNPTGGTRMIVTLPSVSTPAFAAPEPTPPPPMSAPPES
jgi:signal transduction histidine kinase